MAAINFCTRPMRGWKGPWRLRMAGISRLDKRLPATTSGPSRILNRNDRAGGLSYLLRKLGAARRMVQPLVAGVAAHFHFSVPALRAYVSPHPHRLSRPVLFS